VGIALGFALWFHSGSTRWGVELGFTLDHREQLTIAALEMSWGQRWRHWTHHWETTRNRLRFNTGPATRVATGTITR
jgi:hypothetical protein